MSKGLIITEKPSVAKDITKALGGFEEKKKGEYYESDDFICTYAVGHILTLFAPEDIDSKYKRWKLQDLPIIPEKFNMKPTPGQKGRVEAIAKLAKRKDVTYLINACDAAREGELIFREIVKYLEIDKPVSRLWLQSMTKKAITSGFEVLEKGENYDGLAEAAECRANADWMIGMNATRALTLRLKSRSQRGASWSSGRVQTPTLSLLVKREMEVLSHQPEPYNRVKATFKAAGHDYEAYWYDPKFSKAKADDRNLKEDRIFDKKLLESILADLTSNEASAREVRKPSKKSPPLLFDLTTLQRVANSRYGWSAQKTLRAAQRCYETHKVLTYPRTSSKCLPDDYREEVDKILTILSMVKPYKAHAEKLKKDGLLNTEKVFNDAGVTDHFAIIPTGEMRDLEGDDKKLFDLVTRQFMSAFYPPSIYEDVERITEIGSCSFKSKPPKVLKEAGWEAVFEKEVGKGESFPPLAPGQSKVEGVSSQYISNEVEDLETKPPSRISEAGLLSLMENAGRQVDDQELASALKSAEGLGTAATRADIIENLKRKEYVDNGLRPTPKGVRLIDVLSRIDANRLTSAELTARLELNLSEIEAGEMTSYDFMKNIASYVEEVVNKAKDIDFDDLYKDENPLGQCPKCKSPVYEKAWFYGCAEAIKKEGTRNCDFLVWKDNNGRYINRSTVLDLLEKGITRELDGFKSASGKSFKATLELEGGNVVRKNTEAPVDDVTFEVDETPIATCPIHEGKCQVIETAHEFSCKEREEERALGEKRPQGFYFPRLLCKREISREEVAHYLASGETKVFPDFVSKRGRNFSAKLVMEDDWTGFRFEFPPRARKKPSSDEGKEKEKAKEGSESEDNKEATTKKKATTKK